MLLSLPSARAAAAAASQEQRRTVTAHCVGSSFRCGLNSINRRFVSLKVCLKFRPPPAKALREELPTQAGTLNLPSGCRDDGRIAERGPPAELTLTPWVFPIKVTLWGQDW